MAYKFSELAKTKPVDQRAFNNRIALSLLRQCAWMWEHCMRSNNEGTFTMKDVRMGLKGMRDPYKSPAGFIMFDLGYCSCWDVFDRQGIEGARYNAKSETMSMFLPSTHRATRRWDSGAVSRRRMFLVWRIRCAARACCRKYASAIRMASGGRTSPTST